MATEGDAPEGEERSSATGADGESGAELDRVERFVADARIEDAIDARAREHWLRRRASEEATLEGLCWDLAERGEPVVVSTVAGHGHRGRIDALGEDFLAVATRDSTVLVPFHALVTIAARESAEPAARPVRGGVSLAEVLTEVAPERPTVRARCRGGETVLGELRHGGRDVIAVRTGESGRRTVYVRLSSLSDVSVLSG